MTMIIAHRGVSCAAPENTHAAFTLAWALDCAGIELDVQVSKDGAAVVCHDETLVRTGGVDKRINSCDWAEIAAVDVGAWKDEKYRGETLPLLQDVLVQMPAGKTIQVEVKPEVENAAPIIEVLQNVRSDIAVWLMCFNAKLLKEMKTQLLQIPTLYLLEEKDAQDAAAVCNFAVSEGFDGLDVDKKAVDAAFVEACRANGLTLGVWTVDEDADARRMLALGVDMLASNRPHELQL